MVTTRVVFFIFLMATSCWAEGCTENASVSQAQPSNVNPPDVGRVNSVDVILQNLSHQTSTLKSYQCRIEYRFSQPLLGSQTVRAGALYYLKSDGRSNLRINFQTLKQDEEKRAEVYGAVYFRRCVAYGH